MRDSDALVFVEVRHRGGSRFGGAADSITAAKQRKLLLAAEVYLSSHNIDSPAASTRWSASAATRRSG
ncbi:Uncharacterised protein family UPF0102 [Chromobacterium violaceum]|uniref:YraN family protein n=1 Tax=Chromobacterium violaceum TaxID=536 RepID=A0A3S4JTI4_CHRVL|nr:Uncharacterised protein family UPF0102 [Chromobacterium violaceum]